MSGAFDPFGGLSPEERETVEGALVGDTSALRVTVPDVVDLEDVRAPSALPPLPRNRPCPPLDEYVAEQVEAVRREVARGLKNPVEYGEDRMARAERYARWRWQAYKDGDVTSL